MTGWAIQLIYYFAIFLWVEYRYHWSITVIYLLFLGGYIALMYYYGTGDMTRLDVKGPYKVGVRKFRTLKLLYGSEKKTGNDSQVVVYYPIDEKTHDRRAEFG
jgi:hypothetical protein